MPRKAIVEGRVQRVGFRAATQAKGRALSLTGWVRNLDDGNVEAVYASDDSDALSEFEIWLKKGPLRAKVNNLRLLDAPEASLDCPEGGYSF